MFTSWLKRKARLGTLLQSSGDEDEDGLALDRILHGQSVIAKTGLRGTLATFCVLSNCILIRNSQDHRGGQAPVHRQRSRRRWHVRMWPILGCTSCKPELYRLSIVFPRLTSSVAISTDGCMSASRSKNVLPSRHATCISFFPFRTPTKTHVSPLLPYYL